MYIPNRKQGLNSLINDYFWKEIQLKEAFENTAVAPRF